MIFYLLHSINHNIIPGNFSNQTRNLLTFLLGVILYTVLWTYLYNHTNNNNLIITSLKWGFSYILIADCFAIAVIYKNYYKKSINNEIKQVINLTEEKINENPEIKSEYDNTNIDIKELDIVEKVIDEAPIKKKKKKKIKDEISDLH